MCSLTAAMIGLTVGQTGLQMAAQHQQTKAAVQTAEAQAAAAEQNAKIQSRQGELIAEQYAQKQQDLDNRRKLIQGAQRAEAGAAGLAGGEGSLMDSQIATTNAYLKDSVNLLGNLREAEYNNDLKENKYKDDAKYYRYQAAAAKQAGRMAQWGTLLSGAASIYGLRAAQGASSAAKSTSAGIASTPATRVAGISDISNDTILKSIDNTGSFSLPLKTVQKWGGTYKAPQMFDIGYTPKTSKFSFSEFNFFGG